MKTFKKTLKWMLMIFVIWLTYQGLVYGYWLYRGWNDSDLAEDIDKYMAKSSSDDLLRKVKGVNFTIVDPYRDSAWGVLIDRKDKRVVPMLIRELKSWNRETRVTAMRALGDIGDERAVKPLMKIVERAKIDYSYNGSKSPDYIVALEALAKMKYEPAYDYALKLVTTRQKPNNLKGYGVLMLEYFEKPESLPILRKIAEEEKNLPWSEQSGAEEAIQRIDKL